MIQVGDMVEFISPHRHELLPQIYPSERARVIVLEKICRFYDVPILRVRWKRGTTSGNDIWNISFENVRKV